MKILIIKVDGSREIREIGNDPSDTLTALQIAVGGYVQQISGWSALLINDKLEYGCAFCDEEGKIKRRGINAAATRLWHQKLRNRGLSTNDVLVGDIAFIYDKVPE